MNDYTPEQIAKLTDDQRKRFAWMAEDRERELRRAREDYNQAQERAQGSNDPMSALAWAKEVHERTQTQIWKHDNQALAKLFAETEAQHE